MVCISKGNVCTDGKLSHHPSIYVQTYLISGSLNSTLYGFLSSVSVIRFSFTLSQCLFLILQVAELKQELKLRGLTVSGTKNDLIERLRNYQEQNGGNAPAVKNGLSQPSQQTSAASSITSSPTPTTTSDIPSVEGGFKFSLSSVAQVVPGRVMRFGSTSSSPPVSPTPSERSLAGMSPDETSCNGDMFGEMVRSLNKENTVKCVSLLFKKLLIYQHSVLVAPFFR